MIDRTVEDEREVLMATERRFAVVRLLVLFSLLPLLRWGVVSPDSELVLTGLTALIATYILITLYVVPRLPRAPRKDLLLTLDILAATGLVFYTGGVRSDLLVLLYLPVLAAAVRLDLRQTFLSAVAVSAIVVWMWNVAEGGLPSLGQTGVRVGLFTFGSFLVAFVFGILAHETRLSLARASLNRTLDAKLAEASAELRQRLAELESSYRLSRRLAAATEIRVVLEAVTDTAQQQVDAPCSAAFLFDRASGKLSAAHTKGIRVEDAGPMMYACAERLDAGAETPLLVEAADGVQWTRGACAAIDAGGSVAGAVVVGGPEGWVCLDRGLRALANIADQAGVAIQRAYLLRDLQRLALVNPSERLYSREEFDRILHEEAGRAMGLGHSFALLKAQVVGMAEIAEHDRGPAPQLVVKHVASTILSLARRVDVVASDDGGQFFVLLPMANAEGAGQFAVQLRERLREDPTAGRLLPASTPLDVRIGIAVFPDDGLNPPELHFCAQNALDAAEASGDVVWAGELTR